MSRTVKVGENREEGKSHEIDLPNINTNYLAYIAVFGVKIASFAGKTGAYISRLSRSVLQMGPRRLRELTGKMFIILAILTLSLSMTAFMGLNFYMSMTSLDAYTAVINESADLDGVTVVYGSDEWYENGCEVSATISSVEVPCEVLEEGIDSITEHVSANKGVSEQQVRPEVAESAYSYSDIASMHRLTTVLIPVMVGVSALSAMLIAMKSRSVIDIFRRIGTANIISGFMLAVLKPVLPQKVAERITLTGTEPSNIAVFAGRISEVQPFSSQLTSITILSLFLIFSGALMLLYAYYIDRYTR